MVASLLRPWTTVDRSLQELHLLGCLVVDEEPYGQGKVRWIYRLAPGVDEAVLAKFTRVVSKGQESAP